MPTILHSALTGNEVHEPKGIGSASANSTYVANGIGSGVWSEPEPKGVIGAGAGEVYVADGSNSGVWRPAISHASGSLNFNTSSPPYSIGSTTSNQVINPVLTTSNLVDFDYTNTPNMRFTYSGTGDVLAQMAVNTMIRQSSGSTNLVEMALSVNGVIDEASRVGVSAGDTLWLPISLLTSKLLSPTDYAEVVVRTPSSITVDFGSMKFVLTGTPV